MWRSTLGYHLAIAPPRPSARGGIPREVGQRAQVAPAEATCRMQSPGRLLDNRSGGKCSQSRWLEQSLWAPLWPGQRKAWGCSMQAPSHISPSVPGPELLPQGCRTAPPRKRPVRRTPPMQHPARSAVPGTYLLAACVTRSSEGRRAATSPLALVETGRSPWTRTLIGGADRMASARVTASGPPNAVAQASSPA